MLYGSVHVDPAAGWFPHVVGYADETGAGAGAGATRNLPLPEGTGDGPWLERRRRPRRLGRRRGVRRRWWSRSASTPPPTTPRARCWSRTTATARPAACLAATGLPAVVVQEGGYHLPTLGSLVAAYLAGHAETAGS